ncbi:MULTISPECIES: response regulator transcription factor [unclassified Mycobacterium]|uniref:LuxR C-terminal-related transcriptional regulator n=1 Tax=unclassified Mycobacterium TaxID=2642494 RepID=UPI000800B6A4|nr:MULTISPECIES: response regulator transcription factor [unclassified Mycobacterium]OBG74798.1 helix-turn-helix transcriptional regulator [Mycobacterium sp. E1214]OBH27460.1 helix-turn-helix transcriptional regulator [Mycobacterium sp. E1319]
MPPARPITVALVDDYDVVVMGVANMLDRYRDRVVVAELDSSMPVDDVVDIVLYDSFAQPESDQDEIAVLVANPRAHRVVVYTWNFHPDLIASAQRHGAHGYLSKTLPARELVAALEAVHAGATVISDAPLRARSAPGLDWPGRGEGLSDREAEILALITQGKSNADVARLTYLSPNTVKSYIRTIYRKIDAGSRTQAVLWGIEHGFAPDHHRIEHWRSGP